MRQGEGVPRLLLPRLAAARSARDAARGPGADDHPAYAVADLPDDELVDWVERLLTAGRERLPRPEGQVPTTNLWWLDGDTYLGRVQVRHRLTPSLLEVGGHIGYHVAPAHRRRGHARAMLAAALPVAAELGIDCALLTCDAGNDASRKVIEANGGLFHDQRGQKLRFWFPTG